MDRVRLSGQVLFDDGVLRTGKIVIEDGIIADVRETNDARSDYIIAPGFIDLQLNGAFGHDFTANPETISIVAQRLPGAGVTAFLPTIITSPLETYGKAFQQLPTPNPVLPALRDVTHGSVAEGFQFPTPSGAGRTASSLQPLISNLQSRILGLHLEGPYLSPQCAGAHNQAYLLARADPLRDGLVSDPVRLMTLAPELDNGLEAIRALRTRGIVVSIGHSAAHYAQAIAALDAGATWGTHLFNAMTPLHHREPGVIGALLADERAAIGVIADGVHVHPSIFRWLIKAKGAEHITLVSDAMAAAGLGPGEYRLGDRRVIVNETSARLADGTLAGSILTLDQAIRNLVAWRACSLAEALTMASTTPARLLGLHQLGHIKAGCAADLVVLDEKLCVKQTLVGGRIAYER